MEISCGRGIVTLGQNGALLDDGIRRASQKTAKLMGSESAAEACQQAPNKRSLSSHLPDTHHCMRHRTDNHARRAGMQRAAGM